MAQDTTLTFRVSSKKIQQLRKIADSKDRSVSGQIRHLINKCIKKEGK